MTSKATSVKVEALTRDFRSNGTSYGDPNPAASPDEVRKLLASTVEPKLTNTHVEGPVLEGGKQVYKFVGASTTKG